VSPGKWESPDTAQGRPHFVNSALKIILSLRSAQDKLRRRACPEHRRRALTRGSEVVRERAPAPATKTYAALNPTTDTFDSEAKTAIMQLVLLCTRFPTYPMRGAGANDRCRDLYNLGVSLSLLLAILLLAFASWQEGVWAMMSAVAIELAVHLVIAVGSRVQGRTQGFT
jgi:hypothetical protein